MRVIYIRNNKRFEKYKIQSWELVRTHRFVPFLQRLLLETQQTCIGMESTKKCFFPLFIFMAIFLRISSHNPVAFFLRSLNCFWIWDCGFCICIPVAYTQIAISLCQCFPFRLSKTRLSLPNPKTYGLDCDGVYCYVHWRYFYSIACISKVFLRILYEDCTYDDWSLKA